MPFLAAVGRKLFNKRLYVGLLFALVGLEVLVPDPFPCVAHCLRQALGLVWIAAGLGIRAWGSGCAGRHTRSGQIEATRLVTYGPFAYVRNPIYSGTILIGLGMSTLIGDPRAYALAACGFGTLYFGIIPAEEEHLARKFGEEYQRYVEAVPPLIPRLHRWQGCGEGDFRWDAARGEFIIALVLAGIYLGLHFEEYLDRVFPWA